MNREQAARILQLRRRARENLQAYGAYMQSTGEVDFEHPPAAHHLILLEALQNLIDSDEYDKLLVMMPPGGAKSTYTSIQFATWYLATHHRHNVLCASNTEALAENFNRRRLNTCRTKEWEAISKTSLDPKKQGVGEFALQPGGLCRAVGVGSAIVGFRSHLNILDDPVLNFEQAMSQTQMDKHWNWYTADYRSRLVPAGKEAIVTTRWSRRDIPGRILDLIKRGEERGWKVIRMPMECDDPANDPLGREMGDPLWPEWFTDEQRERNKREPHIWMGMYQQVPINEEGVWVGQENIEVVDVLPSALTIVCGVDIALTIGGGDFTVFAVCGVDIEGNLWIIDMRRQQTDPDTTCETFFQLMQEYPDLQAFYIDDDNASKMIDRLLIEKCRSRGISLPLIKMPMRGQDKETRAAPLRGLFMQRRVKILRSSTWNNQLIEELMDFPDVDHDDQIDGLALVARQMPSIPIPTGKYKNTQDMKFLVEEKDGQQRISVPLDDLHKTRGRPGTLQIARRRI